MPVEVAGLFKGVSLSLATAKYLGIIQDKLAAKIDQLAGAEFEAGTRALGQASASKVEQAYLLREARGRFNKAVSLEKGLRLGLAHLGLALCHWHLGDRVNAKQSITELLSVQAPEIPIASTVAAWLVNRMCLDPNILIREVAAMVAARKYEVLEERTQFAELQQSARDCFSEL